MTQSEVPARVRWVEVGVLLALLASGAWLRLSGLAEWQLSWDEMWHLMDAQQASLGAVLERNLRHEIHGPLSYVVVHGQLALGHDVLWLRAVSLVPGLLLIPVGFLLGREWFGRAAGFFLAAVVTFADLLVELSQVLRAYSLLSLWLALALLCLSVWHRTRRRGALVGYAVAGTLAAFTHVSAAVPLAGLGLTGAVFALVSERNALGVRRAGAWLGLHAAVSLPAPAWAAVQLYFVGARAASPAANLGRFVDHYYFLKPLFPDSPWDALLRLPDAYRVMLFGSDGSAVAGIVWLAAAVAGGVVWWRQGGRAPVAACGAVVVAAMLLGVLGLYPFSATRHCVYLLPFLLLPSAAAVAWAVRRVGPLAVASVGLALLGLTVDFDPASYRRARSDFGTRAAELEHTLAALSERVGPRDVVLANRVGMQYLNLHASLLGEDLEHVSHPDAHAQYPYDQWVLPGGEEHIFRDMRFWACDGPHLWSSYLSAPAQLRPCVERLLDSREVDSIWIWVAMREPFLVFTARRPIEAVREQPPEVQRFLLALRRSPFGSLLLRRRTGVVPGETAGAVAVRAQELQAAW
ncbi:MAG: hypothetical protein MJE66_18615 [Proteobacteria bacterium]|nr:hypothetical protein [Pseudomonadota bacterium]